MSTIEELKTASEAAQHALDEALADGNALPISKARKAALEAREAVSDALAVQRVLQQREQAAKREAEAVAKAAQRAKIAEFAAQRGEVAARLAALTEQLGAEVTALNDLHREILISLPGKFDADRAVMTSFNDRVLGQLWRTHTLTGSPWGDWEMQRLPTMLQQITDGNAYLRSL